MASLWISSSTAPEIDCDLAVPCYLESIYLQEEQVVQESMSNTTTTPKKPIPSASSLPASSPLEKKGSGKFASPELMTPKKIAAPRKSHAKLQVKLTTPVKDKAAPPRGSDKKPRCKRGEAGTFAGRRPPSTEPRKSQFTQIRASWPEVKESARNLNLGHLLNQDKYLLAMTEYLKQGVSPFENAMNSFLEKLEKEEAEPDEKTKQ